MSSLRNRFSFGRPKDGTTARFTENKPTRSSSLPTLSFPKRIFSLARSNSLGKYKPEPHPRRGIDDADRVCSREGDSLNRTGDRDKSSSQHAHSTDAQADQYPTASSRNQTRIASPAETQRDDLLGADEGTPEPTGSLEDLDERGNIKPVEFSPIDEAVISMLQELDDNMLDSTPRLGTTEESLLETIYEEPDCDESLRPSTPESRLSSSAASSTTVAEIPPSVSPPGETQQEDNIDGAEETLPIHSSPLTFHEMQAAVNEWEEKKSRHRKSYSATLPPSPTENLEVQLQPFDYDDLD